MEIECIILTGVIWLSENGHPGSIICAKLLDCLRNCNFSRINLLYGVILNSEVCIHVSKYYYE